MMKVERVRRRKRAKQSQDMMEMLGAIKGVLTIRFFVFLSTLFSKGPNRRQES